MIIDYLGKKHSYGTNDCASLLKNFYLKELGINFDIPEYPQSKKWMREYTFSKVESYLLPHGKRVEWVDAKDYDLLVFKSPRRDMVIHFALYLTPYKMFHVLEGRTSSIDNITQEWLTHLAGVYRHHEMV